MEIKNLYKKGILLRSFTRTSLLLVGLGLAACKEESDPLGPEVSNESEISISSSGEKIESSSSSKLSSSSNIPTSGISNSMLVSSSGASAAETSTPSSSSEKESGKSSSSVQVSSSIGISSVDMLSSSENLSSGEIFSSSEVSSSSEPYFIEGSLVDIRDQKEYRTVKIGEQTWMGENLNYQGGTYSCRLGVDSLCDAYGALYTWGDAMVSSTRVCEANDCSLSKDYKYPGICPEGWHVPQIEEWKTLFNTMGNRFTKPLTMQSSYYNTMTYTRTYYWHDIGEHLKSTTGWESYYTSNGVPGVNYHNGPDLFGFSALWYQEGATNNVTSWWTPTSGSGGYFRISVFLSSEEVAWSTIENTKSFHIRCVLDG